MSEEINDYEEDKESAEIKLILMNPQKLLQELLGCTRSGSWIMLPM